MTRVGLPSRPSRIKRPVAALALVVATGGLASCATRPSDPPPAPVTRTGTGMISSTVSVPSRYETIYLSGMTGTLPRPRGGGPAPDSGDTQTQAVRALERIKAALAEQQLTLGDIVMMHAYLAPDPQTGRGDMRGWTAAYTKYFGTPEQPNKPARTSITVVLGGADAKIEIETIAVRKAP